MAERMSEQAINAGIADTRQRLRDAKAEVEARSRGIGSGTNSRLPLPFDHRRKLALGSMFLFAGAMTVVHAFSAGSWRGFFWNGIDLGDWLPGRDQHDNGGLELHRPGAQQAAASHLDKHAASIECKLPSATRPPVQGP